MGLPLSYARFEPKAVYYGPTDKVGVPTGKARLQVGTASPDPDFGPMTWTLEPYSSNHRAACLAIFESNLPEFVTAPERGPFGAFLDMGACTYFVVKTAEDVIAACGGYDAQPGEARLCWGLVERTRHRQGIGRFLLRSRLLRIHEQYGDTVVRMDTCQLTFAFFELFGFRVVDRIEHGYRAGLHRLEMELQLDAQVAEELRLT